MPSSKRKRNEQAQESAEANEPVDESNQQAPMYGSQTYWEERYQGRGDESPNHAWYYTYEDLRPLLLPLILGGRQETRDLLAATSAAATEPEDVDAEPSKPPAVRKENPAQADGDEISHTGSCNDDEEEEEEEEEESDGEDGDNEDDEGTSNVDPDDGFEEVSDEEEVEQEANLEREGLAATNPIAVLEVGCGDVPLGVSLARDLHQLNIITTHADAQNFVKQILCTDYSAIVIEAIKKEYSKQDSSTKPKVAKLGTVPLSFEVADARKLPYADDSFQLVLEKGTLDAMLSDKEVGEANCVTIVSECARVLDVGGCIVLISHLNAHIPKGMGWLQDVVVKGLRNGGANAQWVIEVHGNDGVEENNDAVEVCSESPGPAVYVIHKMPLKEGESPKETVPVNFYTY